LKHSRKAPKSVQFAQTLYIKEAHFGIAANVANHFIWAV